MFCHRVPWAAGGVGTVPLAGISAHNERSAQQGPAPEVGAAGAPGSAAGVTAALSPVIAATGLREVSPTSRHAAFALRKVTQLIMYRARVQRFPCGPWKPAAPRTPQAALLPV